MGEDFVLEIRRGQGEPRFLRLPRGADLQPTSVGARGDFRVDADGVLDVHMFVYFDGEALFVQSADARMAVRVNGRPVSGEWTQVESPCTLAFGDARVVFCPASQASAAADTRAPSVARPAAGARPLPKHVDMEDMPTVADMRPDLIGHYDDDVQTTRVAPPSRGVAGHVAEEDATHSIPLPGGRPLPPQPVDESADHETTRALPLPAVALPSQAQARPAPPPPAASAPPVVATQNQPIAAPPPAPKIEEKPKPLDQLKTQWKEASLPKKAILVLLPIAFVMVIFGLDDDSQPAKKPRPAASQSAVSVKPSASATETKKTKVEPEPEPEPVQTDKTAKAPEPTTKPPSETTSKPTTSGSSKTPERAAVDAVAAGSYDPAAKMYDDLAKAHPENPAYKEAARILRSKAKK